ncbi:MAG: hypothetical protein ACRCZP_16305 [Phycicoccus sp.]
MSRPAAGAAIAALDPRRVDTVYQPAPPEATYVCDECPPRGRRNAEQRDEECRLAYTDPESGRDAHEHHACLMCAEQVVSELLLNGAEHVEVVIYT